VPGRRIVVPAAHSLSPPPVAQRVAISALPFGMTETGRKLGRYPLPRTGAPAPGDARTTDGKAVILGSCPSKFSRSSTGRPGEELLCRVLLCGNCSAELGVEECDAEAKGLLTGSKAPVDVLAIFLVAQKSLA